MQPILMIPHSRRHNVFRWSLSGLLILTLCPGWTAAEVVRVEVTNRSNARQPGYEQIAGRLYFEIDPKLPANAVIADVSLAAVNAAGKVCFSSDFRLWKPKDPAHSNGAAWFEIPNRGSKASLSDWMAEQGFVLLTVGWEFDVPATRQDALRIDVPRAVNQDGTPLRGLFTTSLIFDKPASEYIISSLEDYPAVDLAGKDSRLVARLRASDPADEVGPGPQWSIQGNRLLMKDGFEPGRTYDFSYLSEGPPVAGLGNAAIRDAAAWLKHAPDSPAPMKHLYAFGSSQCGRMLRDFIYLGFNTDEQERQAFDGVLAHVAGAGRLVLNERWSAPRAVAGYATTSYPFADTAHPDPVSGHLEGVLENPRVKHPPRIFYINMAAEYWGAGRVAALTHVSPDGKQDLSLPENVRSYFFAGTSHGPAPFPPKALVDGAPLANPVSSRAALVALRQAMHLWVTAGTAPPPSVYPRLSDGTLTPVKDVHFPKVPGMSAPNAVTAGLRIGNPQWPDGAGAGTELPLLVPQVDEDGNDLGGIRMPDVAVPLGTATGWVFRPKELGSPEDVYLLRGAWVPFARTRSEREAVGDPRLSLEERYPSKADYLAKVERSLQFLIQQRFLFETDLAPQLQQASDRWDWVMSR